MINSLTPKTWRQLQSDVAQILSECGLNVEIEKTLMSARGKVIIDVYASDYRQSPEIIYLCECKNWNTHIPKTVIYSFRTIVSDHGANWGLIIAKKGFQKGAYEAAKNTNLRLLNWGEFQMLFAELWYKHYFVNKLAKEARPIIEYTEPINSRIMRKVQALSHKKQKTFLALQDKYSTLGYISLCLQYYEKFYQKTFPNIPLINEWPNLKGKLADEILLAPSFRELIELIIKHINIAIIEFDNLFGVRM